MQKIIIEKPYRFIPPHRGTWWPSLVQKTDVYSWYLRRTEGVVDHEIRHADRLRASLDAGHGIMLTPNHCRAGDPLVIGWLARAVHCHVYAMASWHLFHQDWFTAFAIRKMGGFSVNREGVDRQAINVAIEVLETAERPLILFPEGAVSRTNDRLHALYDGVAFIARTAAKRREKRLPGGKVVVHPVALKYLFQGDLEATVDKALRDIEHRFTWNSQTHVPLFDRVAKIGVALLCLKELEYFGQVQSGTLEQRLEGLTNRLLQPLEAEWLSQPREGPVVPRVKALRMRILPEMVQGRLDEAERERRWSQLADIYLAQQVSCYPPDYLDARCSVDRLRETVERFEEDLADRAAVHGSLKAVMEVGPAIEVSAKRDRDAETDPLMDRIRNDLQSLLDRLAEESPRYERPAAAQQDRGPAPPGGSP